MATPLQFTAPPAARPVIPPQPQTRSALMAHLLEQSAPDDMIARPPQSVGEGIARTAGMGLDALMAKKVIGTQQAEQQQKLNDFADLLEGVNPELAAAARKGVGLDVANQVLASKYAPQKASVLVEDKYDEATGQPTKAISYDNGATWQPFGGTKAPEAGGSGPFAGTALDAQDSNILLTGDPASPEYEVAYTRQFLTPKYVMGTNENGQVTQTPVYNPVPPSIRPPAVKGGAAPAASPAPAPDAAAPAAAGGSPTVGAPIVVGPVKPTEQQVRNRQLYSVTAPELERVKENFAALTDMSNQIASMVLPKSAASFVTTPQYQRASNALRTIIATYLYSTSGATANPGEVENQISVLMPVPGEDPASVADKLQRIETMVNSIKVAGGPQPDAKPGAAPAGVTPEAPAVPAVPQGAIDMLKANPSLAPEFDKKYGAGASKRILNGG